MKRCYIIMIALVLVGIIGFFLPPQLMEWKDGQQVDISHTKKAEEIALVSQTSLSLTEKMDLYQRKTSNTLGVVRGKNYDQESIEPKVREELQKLCDLGILDIDLDTIEFAAFEGGFVVDTEDSTQTMNIWMVYAYHTPKGYELWAVLDDETGKIFSICQSDQMFESVAYSDSKVTHYGPDTEQSSELAVMNPELQEIAECWAQYLELSMVEIYHTATGTMDVDKEIENEIKALIKQGMNETEAFLMVHEAWGIDSEYIKGRLLCVVEDEQGMASYLIRKEIGNIMLSIDLSM